MIMHLPALVAHRTWRWSCFCYIFWAAFDLSSNVSYGKIQRRILYTGKKYVWGYFCTFGNLIFVFVFFFLDQSKIDCTKRTCLDRSSAPSRTKWYYFGKHWPFGVMLYIYSMSYLLRFYSFLRIINRVQLDTVPPLNSKQAIIDPFGHSIMLKFR